LSDDNEKDRRVFGVPAVLTATESKRLYQDLAFVWAKLYGHPSLDLDADLDLCRRFFDPIARGHTLRERLSTLPVLPIELSSRLLQYGEPLVIDTGKSTLLLGVEARLMMEVLTNRTDRTHHVISRNEAAAVERIAMNTYRKWTLSRLRQVIDMRAGTGAEVLQAVAVGLVLALLVNRSDAPERAVVQWNRDTPDGKDIDKAIYSGAEGFASVISPRNRRSSSERTLKSGYALTEARRRLAEKLVVRPDPEMGGARIYVPEEYRSDVVTFLGRDLARRPGLTSVQVADAFDRMVSDYRTAGRALAYRSMIFERPADTADLKGELLTAFLDAGE
jgi:hypothetical protein